MNENSDNITKLLKHYASTQSTFDEINEMLNKIESLNKIMLTKQKVILRYKII